MTKKKTLGRLLATSLAAGTLFVPLIPVHAESVTKIKLRILETTDIHANIVNYDYYKDKATDEFGLAKTAALIKKTREEAPNGNSLLFDNGDLIQGNPLGDYVAKVNPLKQGEIHPVYKAMNQLNYDVGNIGNHEFNFGLDFLDNSLKGAKFPYVNANVYIDDKDNNPDNDKNKFTPYLILDKKFKDESGKEQNVKVGVIGFVPPQIMTWDKQNLTGKVITKDIVETAKKFVPKMKAEGADIIVAVAHSGFEQAASKGMDENAVYYLSEVDGIDAILFGHAHKLFPAANFEGIKGIDIKKGTLNGKAAIMPGYWGNHLGQIDMTLEQKDGKWVVADTQSTLLPIYDKTNKKTLVDADQAIVDSVKHEHDATLEYVRKEVAKTTAPINSFFALVQDDPSVQIVNAAQKWYVEEHIKGTEYAGIPVLSAAAPFKAGGRNGSSYYTDIPAGTLAIKNVSDLYLYDNTLKAVLLNGAEVKEWLEFSAGQFNQIYTKKDIKQLVAVGQVAKEAGITVNYDTKTKTVTLFKGDVKVTYTLGAKEALINGKKTAVEAVEKDGKLQMPVGFLESTFKVVLGKEQSLINLDFPTYNFDVIDGVTYQIDVTQPAKYDPTGKLANEKASRIVNLKYQGKPVAADQKFIVVTNSYRAFGGGNFPGLTKEGKNVIIDTQEENRQILVQYLATQKSVNPSADGNWSLAPLKERVNVTFETSPSAKQLAEKLGYEFITNLESGFATFSIDLSKASQKK